MQGGRRVQCQGVHSGAVSGDVPSFHIVPIAEEETYDLRRRISAEGFVLGSWHHEFDDIPGARYLGAVEVTERRVIGTCSLYPAAFPRRPDADPSIRLMFMAVEPALQRCGIGTALMRTALRDIRAQQARLLWATARDAAIPFYTRFGFSVGDPLPVTPPGRPLHYIYLDLQPPTIARTGTSGACRS